MTGIRLRGNAPFCLHGKKKRAVATEGKVPAAVTARKCVCFTEKRLSYDYIGNENRKDAVIL